MIVEIKLLHIDQVQDMIMVITNILNTNERNQLMVYKDLIKMQGVDFRFC
jgi:hypothetical protein